MHQNTPGPMCKTSPRGDATPFLRSVRRDDDPTVTTKCACGWSHAGSAAEGRAAFAKHRQKAHGGPKLELVEEAPADTAPSMGPRRAKDRRRREQAIADRDARRAAESAPEPEQPPAKRNHGGSRAVDMTGRRFGHWEVLRRAENTGPKKNLPSWECRCDCDNCDGTVRVVTGGSLRKGASTSCTRRRPGHGHVADGQKSPTYTSWQSLARRGVMPARWDHGFTSFLEDMGKQPSPGMVVMRRDPSKDHGPDNSLWVGS